MGQNLFFLICLCLSVPVLSQFFLNTNQNRPGVQYKATQGEIWPKPASITRGKKHYNFFPLFLKFRGASQRCPIIYEAVARCKVTLLKQLSVTDVFELNNLDNSFTNDKNKNSGKINSVIIDQSGECETHPHEDMEESYTLKIGDQDGDGVAVIHASTVWGVMRGLESFSQLSFFNGTRDMLTVGEVTIEDKPKFKHRGLMIDTARHYLNLSTIKLMLEAMEYNKFNVLHWHITDDQSFPYQSEVYPELSKKGAYRNSKIYTINDVAMIIDYARVRGIRVIPEFDTPGHTQSWGLSYPDLLTKCYHKSVPTDNLGPVDPSKKQNFIFLEKLFTELSHVFTDKRFHFGGDEVDFSCWESNPGINKFMDKLNISGNYPKLQSYYMGKVHDIADKLNISSIVWQEVFLNDENLNNDTIVQIWSGDQKFMLNKVTGSGHKAILSTCWYLDHFGRDIYAGGGDWKDFYNCNPVNFYGTPEMKSRVIGGEACMWGEYVDDTNIIQRVWPRACAAAEKLWSSSTDTLSHAANRLEEHVCRLRIRGIMAQPPNGPSTC